jgi:CARDB protein
VSSVLLTGSRRALLACAVAAAALTVAAAGAPARPSTDANAAQAFSIDHFQCYRATGPKFRPRKVKLRDQFGRSTAKVLSRPALCNPVSKNGEGIKDKRAHLACYAIKRHGKFKRRRVEVRHQFTDGMRLAVVRPVRLCLPTAKSETEPPKADDIPKLDHYQCYAVKPIDRFKPRAVKLEDQFGGVKARVGRAFQLCNPVSKNGGEILNRRDHLVCHTLTTDEQFDPRKVFITNQYETGRRIKAVRRESLCFPARKRVLGPDLVPRILTAPAVTCPGGQGTCTTTFRWRVDNIGTAAAGAFDVLLSADPGLATTATVSVAGLAAGASTGPLSTTLGPANNCFDPDCTISVKADSGNAVAESNEGNNVATSTTAG